MSKTYTVGTLGSGGRPINFAGGELFEAMDNGGFSSRAAAARCAAEMAREWARDSDWGECEVAVAVNNGDGSLSLVATATARPGHKRVRWS